MEGGQKQRRVSQENIFNIETQNTLANVDTNIRFNEGLSLRTMLAANIIIQQVNRYSGRTLPFLSRNEEGIASISPLRRDNWQYENLLTFIGAQDEANSINSWL